MTEKHREKIDTEVRDIYNYAADKISDFMRKECDDAPGYTLSEQLGDFPLILERADV